MKVRFLIQFICAILLCMVFTGKLTARDWEWGKRMKSLFADSPAAASKPSSATDSAYERGRAKELRPDITVPPPPEAEDPTTPKLYSNPDEKSFNEMISGLENIAGLAPKTEMNIETIPTQPHRPVDSAKKVRWAPPPPGFLTADTYNYLIYRENQQVTPKIQNVLNNIHGNLMLDLTPFTIILKPNKILVMLFDAKKSYMDFTKLPAWSGASSDLRSDSMYVIEDKSFYPLTVHELTHLYFDGYFLPTISPLWLSEGMAVYMQVHASKQKPAWIAQGLRQIIAGNIIPLEELTQTEDINSYSTEKAGLYYAEAYSVVDYLLNTRSRDEFYKFCSELKQKTPVYQALYRAYGMPFNKVSTLENVWLHDLQKAYREQQQKQLQQQQQILQQAPTIQGGAFVKKTSQLLPATPTDPAGLTNRQPVKQPQKTVIPQLQKVPTNYSGGF